MKVLVAENEHVTLKFLRDILEKEGYEVIAVTNGYDAYQEYMFSSPDFVILDIEMPDMSGFEVCEKIRQDNLSIPIVFITAMVESNSKIKGFNIGADDYITKPFDIHEVVARIRTITRRCLANTKVEIADQIFSMRHIKVIPQKLVAQRDDGTEVDLSLRDIKILKILYHRKNSIITRDEILDYCWGRHIMPESRTIDWHISQLRKKIEIDPKMPTIIQTVHGVGYKFLEDI